MTEKKAKKFLLDLASEWQEVFGLGDWSIEYQWYTGDIPGAGNGTVMVTMANWSYKWATIDVNLAMARGQSKKTLEEEFFHEVGHILCRVFKPGKRSTASRQEERFCTDLAQIIQRIGKHCYEKGVEAGTPAPTQAVADLQVVA